MPRRLGHGWRPFARGRPARRTSRPELLPGRGRSGFSRDPASGGTGRGRPCLFSVARPSRLRVSAASRRGATRSLFLLAPGRCRNSQPRQTLIKSPIQRDSPAHRDAPPDRRGAQARGFHRAPSKNRRGQWGDPAHASSVVKALAEAGRANSPARASLQVLRGIWPRESFTRYCG